jgi:hypothetical protein
MGRNEATSRLARFVNAGRYRPEFCCLFALVFLIGN